MFAKIFALFALVACALASPAPAPAPKPQLLTYTSGVDYVVPVAYSAYSAPVAYSPYVAAAPAPLTYSGVYLR